MIFKGTFSFVLFILSGTLVGREGRGRFDLLFAASSPDAHSCQNPIWGEAGTQAGALPRAAAPRALSGLSAVPVPAPSLSVQFALVLAHAGDPHFGKWSSCCLPRVYLQKEN